MEASGDGMRGFVGSATLAAVSSLFVACGDSSGPTQDGPRIQLTSSQAALLVNRVSQIAPVHPELSWLADSVSLVLTSGAFADRIDVVTDLGGGPFYAVGLQRAMTTSSGQATATFDIIAFNDPSNPTDFIIVDGWTRATTSTPPSSVAGPFGQSADLQLSGHLFHVSGSIVTAWRAEGGTASFAGGTSGGACDGFQQANGVTCAQSALQSTFSITVARQDGGVQSSDTRSASLSATDVTGILLTLTF
jgi:hypothetical protein